MEPISPVTLAQSLSGIWSALHAGTAFTISDSQVHYLTGTALAMDDDLLSHLLLKKMKLAQICQPAALPDDLVTMNSFVEYVFGAQERCFRQLVHPSSTDTSYGLSVASLEGIGVLGMRSGQSILWPDKEGTLVDLHVLHVENCPGLSHRDTARRIRAGYDV